jgi:hypothetical protein
LTLFRFDPLIPSLQGSNTGAEQGDLFFLFLQLDPLFFDLFVGDTLLRDVGVLAATYNIAIIFTAGRDSRS